MSVDSSILYRTLTTTSTHPETIFDPSIGADVLRTDGQLEYYVDSSSAKPAYNVKEYRPNTHLQVDTSIIESMFPKSTNYYNPSYYYCNRYEELNNRLLKAKEKFYK